MWPDVSDEQLEAIIPGWAEQRRVAERIAARRAMSAPQVAAAAPAAAVAAPALGASLFHSAIGSMMPGDRENALRQAAQREQGGALFPRGPVYPTERGEVLLRMNSSGTDADNVLYDKPTADDLRAMSAERAARARETEANAFARNAPLQSLTRLAEGYISQGAAPPSELLDAINQRVQQRQGVQGSLTGKSPPLPPQDDPTKNPLAQSEVGNKSHLLELMQRKMAPTLSENLQRGIFGSDVSASQLRRAVNYLNSQTDSTDARGVFKSMVENDPMLRDRLRAAQIAKSKGARITDPAIEEALRYYEASLAQ